MCHQPSRLAWSFGVPTVHGPWVWNCAAMGTSGTSNGGARWQAPRPRVAINTRQVRLAMGFGLYGVGGQLHRIVVGQAVGRGVDHPVGGDEATADFHAVTKVPGDGHGLEVHMIVRIEGRHAHALVI